MEVVAFAPEHLDGVLALCRSEGWPSLASDPARALRTLTAPGVVTVVALEHGGVVGFAQLLGDGGIQAYLCALAVAMPWRRRGVGSRLIGEGFSRSGALRLDLLAGPGSEAFYRSFPHRPLPGYRIYPGGAAPPRP